MGGWESFEEESGFDERGVEPAEDDESRETVGVGL